MDGLVSLAFLLLGGVACMRMIAIVIAGDGGRW